MWLIACWILSHWTTEYYERAAKIEANEKEKAKIEANEKEKAGGKNKQNEKQKTKEQWMAEYASFWWNWAEKTEDFNNCPVRLPFPTPARRQQAPPPPVHAAWGVAFPTTSRFAPGVPSPQPPAPIRPTAWTTPTAFPPAQTLPPRPDPAKYGPGVLVPARLPNVGNTCFMNAALQCLYAIEPLRTFFLSDFLNRENVHAVTKERLVLLRAYRSLQIGMRDYREKVDLGPALRDLLRSIGKSPAETRSDGSQVPTATKFMLGPQADAGEFLVALLDELQEGLVQLSGRPTVIEQTFGSTFIQTITCESCHHSESARLTGNWVLPLALDERVTDGQLESYIMELTPGDERLPEWECGACTLAAGSPSAVTRPAVKSLAWSTLPPFLLFQFGIYRRNAGVSVKTVPQNLRYPQELLMDSRMRGISDQAHRYSLAGVAAHIGSLGGGHYVASVRMTDTWLGCSDNRILESSEEQAGGTPSPYLFVYERQQ
jgi:ubiquitin C-terminal hydrolase